MVAPHPLLGQPDIDDRHLVIGGAPAGVNGRFPVIDPATGSVFAHCPAATVAQLDKAVGAARAAFPGWSHLAIEDRAALIEALADRIVVERDGLARLISAEQGKPYHSAALGEMAGAVHWARATAALRPAKEVIRDDGDARVELFRRPLGVVGSITPWNHPVMIAVWHVMPALLAGNCVIIKPSPYTPFATLRLIEIANEVLPPGVVNSVTGGAEIGRAMASHAGIDKLVFTGSTGTGRQIMADAARTLKRLTLELGGNDAAIVLDDVDVDKVAPRIFAAAFLNSGQTCAAIKRLYVQEAVHDTLAERLADLAREARVGPGHDPQTQFGPVQNRAQFDHVLELAHSATADGGRFLAGGQPLGGDGYFFPLTIVTGLADGSALVDREQFGPILPIIGFRDPDDAIARANASESGLGGSVWSSDGDRAVALAARLECGTAWINDHASIAPDTPFGGAKQSGLGVEFGLPGLDEYCQLQAVRRSFVGL